MRLESLTTKLPNIRSLVIEDPDAAPRLPFDPERDIAENEWPSLEQMIERFTLGNAICHKEIAFYILLRPLVNIAEHASDFITEIHRNATEQRTKKHWGSYFRYIRSLAILGQQLPPISDEEWQTVRGDYFIYETPVIAAGKILYGRASETDDVDLKLMREDLINKEGIVNTNCAFFLILSGNTPALTEADWAKMYEAYERQSEDYVRMNHLAGMWLLSAGHLVQTSEGLRVQPKPKLKLNIEPMPDLRKFVSALPH